ncbi:8497_t:CDS:10 [Entrophospora sp. SA101]|nr:8497_t:CDS:10 [Entrophospora sp. SA101]
MRLNSKHKTSRSFINFMTPKIQVDEVVIDTQPIEEEPTRPTVVITTDVGSTPPELPEKSHKDVLISEARISAKKCFEEDESFIRKELIAEFLGGNKKLNSLALKFYMDYFDFSNLRLDVAFRHLCGKLYIKGETQQVDRILERFSIRYWECNPKSAYGSSVTSKMSRSQFIRNTMSTVHAQANLSAQNNNSVRGSYEDDCSTITSVETSNNSPTSSSATTSPLPSPLQSPSSSPSPSRPRRSESIRSWRSNTNLSLTNLSFVPSGFSRQWDAEIENSLLSLSSYKQGNNALALQRSISKISRPNTRLAALKKGIASNISSKENNSHHSNKDSSKNTKLSPSPSFASGSSGDMNNSRNSLYRSNSSQTLPTTLSSFSLRHASSSETVFTSTIAESADEELYLSGAPYAKEGLLFRKHFWESSNKRSKDKNWKECFVVVEKGELRLYKFDSHGSNSSAGVGAMGGGNWMENATALGEINLCHTITNSLPPPGYNRSRPHVFALSIPNGGLYFFQAGTAELVEEWVSTCNYWAARTSKEPLTGGVSNIEYGWGRCLALDDDDNNINDDNKSIMSDMRSTISFNSMMHPNSGASHNKIFIHEWKPPLPPGVSSVLDEDSQLAALKKYRADLENDLEEHKNYWEPMSKLFTPRSTNNSKAFTNWEKKSQWLLYEIIKYSTYIESLENSISLKLRRRKEKESPSPLLPGKISSEEEIKKEQSRAEFRARARKSVQMLHRATWTPGDGFSLSLPKELLFGDALDDGIGGNGNKGDSNGSLSDNGPDRCQKGTSYPTLEMRGVVEEETKLGNIRDSDYGLGYKWVDRFG